jgi:hypothetical protein
MLFEEKPILYEQGYMERRFQRIEWGIVHLLQKGSLGSKSDTNKKGYMKNHYITTT